MKTVEMHLSNAYLKLDIGSRGELEAALSGGMTRPRPRPAAVTRAPRSLSSARAPRPRCRG